MRSYAIFAVAGSLATVVLGGAGALAQEDQKYVVNGAPNSGANVDLNKLDNFYFAGEQKNEYSTTSIRIGKVREPNFKGEPEVVYKIDVLYQENFPSWTLEGRDGEKADPVGSAMFPRDLDKEKPAYNTYSATIPASGSSSNTVHWYTDFGDSTIPYVCNKQEYLDAEKPSIPGSTYTTNCDTNATGSTLKIGPIVLHVKQSNGNIESIEGFESSDLQLTGDAFVPFNEDPSSPAFRPEPPTLVATDEDGEDVTVPYRSVFGNPDFCIESPGAKEEQGSEAELQYHNGADCRSWASIHAWLSHWQVYELTHEFTAADICKHGGWPAGTGGSVFAAGEDLKCSPSAVKGIFGAAAAAGVIDHDQALVCIHTKPCPPGTPGQVSEGDPNNPTGSGSGNPTGSGGVAANGLTYLDGPISRPTGNIDRGVKVECTKSEGRNGDANGKASLQGAPAELQNAYTNANNYFKNWKNGSGGPYKFTGPQFNQFCGDRYFFFSGSDDIMDWVGNLMIWPVTVPGVPGMGAWHAGFVFDSLWWLGLVHKYGNPRGSGYKTTFGGHSLGGAIAQVLATYWKTLHLSQNVRLVTFGAPAPQYAFNPSPIFHIIPHEHFTNIKSPCASPNGWDPVARLTLVLGGIHGLATNYRWSTQYKDGSWGWCTVTWNGPCFPKFWKTCTYHTPYPCFSCPSNWSYERNYRLVIPLVGMWFGQHTTYTKMDATGPGQVDAARPVQGFWGF